MNPLSSLALLLQNDPFNTNSTTITTSGPSANTIAGLGIGMIVVGGLIVLAIIVFWIYLCWKIFVKAGMSGALSLLNLIPYFGPVICLCILAFGQWKVIPANGVNPYSGPPVPYPPNPYPQGQLPPTQAYPTQDYGQGSAFGSSTTGSSYTGSSGYPPSSGQV